MILKLTKVLFAVGGVVVLVALIVVAIMQICRWERPCFLGGTVGTAAVLEAELPASAGGESIDYSERFQRPSKQAAIPERYKLREIEQGGIPFFERPEDVLYGYYGILKEACNLGGYVGGCGTVGLADIPYPYAYSLLTLDAKKKMTLKQFTGSFEGIGHISLLKIQPAYSPAGTAEDVRYFFVEVETITGRKYDGNPQPGLFAYYYGIAAVKNEGGGWKIEKINYLPEDFLCAPYHGWIYDAQTAAQIIYGDNLHLIDKITGTEEKDGLVEVYATGVGKEYRFQYVRLTNGYDILLHEYVKENGAWVETNLLKDPWTDYKLTTASIKK